MPAKPSLREWFCGNGELYVAACEERRTPTTDEQDERYRAARAAGREMDPLIFAQYSRAQLDRLRWAEIADPVAAVAGALACSHQEMI